MRNELIHETIRDLMHESRLSNKAIVEQVVLLQKEVSVTCQQLQDSVRLTNELLKELLLQSLKSGSRMEPAILLKENKKNSSSSSSRSKDAEVSSVIDPWQNAEQEAGAEANAAEWGLKLSPSELVSKFVEAVSPEDEPKKPVEAVSTYAWTSGPDPRFYQRGFPTNAVGRERSVPSAQGKFVSGQSQQQDFDRNEFEREPELTQEELAQLGRIYFGR
jgi:hypothetical protein